MAALAQRLIFVRTDEIGIHHLTKAQSQTFGTGAVGGIEGKEARLDLFQRHAAVGTGIVDGIEFLFALAVDDDQSVRELQGVSKLSVSRF